MANHEQLASIRRGTHAWNQWRGDNPAVEIDLSGAGLTKMGLSGADLGGANLRRADLLGADLSSANLSQANLSQANLKFAQLRGANLKGAYLGLADLSQASLLGADLSSAILNEANLFGADLRDATLNQASLHGVDLRDANLQGAHLSKASMYYTVLGGVDLSTVKGLDEVIHYGLSTIGIDTIYRSQGKIPEAFLRGAGVPDNFITYMGSQTGKDFEFYSCFISYSTKDQEFAERLHADLESKGVRCWFAPEDAQGGKKLNEQVYEAISQRDKVLLVLSPNSLQSEWVMTEIRRTRRLEVEEQRRRLFPIRLVDYNALRQWECFDADTGKDLAIEVREYFVPDFSSWKDHDAYSKAFDHLLRDLQQAAKTNNK